MILTNYIEYLLKYWKFVIKKENWTLKFGSSTNSVGGSNLTPN